MVGNVGKSVESLWVEREAVGQEALHVVLGAIAMARVERQNTRHFVLIYSRITHRLDRVVSWLSFSFNSLLLTFSPHGAELLTKIK